METKNNVLVIGLLALILGLVIGYFAGTSAYRPFGMMGGNCSQTRDAGDFSGMHGAMSGMMTGLSGKTGDAMDKAFLDGMIIHHEGAVEMAQALLQSTKRPELIKLGNDIVAAQTGEIRMMKEWRTAWFNQ